MPSDSSHISDVANHIANFLFSPDFMFVQEIQDNSGSTDDGTVNANVTLTNLSNAIAKAANSSTPYGFVEVIPENANNSALCVEVELDGIKRRTGTLDSEGKPVHSDTLVLYVLPPSTTFNYRYLCSSC